MRRVIITNIYQRERKDRIQPPGQHLYPYPGAVFIYNFKAPGRDRIAEDACNSVEEVIIEERWNGPPQEARALVNRWEYIAGHRDGGYVAYAIIETLEDWREVECPAKSGKSTDTG